MDRFPTRLTSGSPSELSRGIVRKFVFFSPHSSVWVHAFPEALVAEALVAAGHEVIVVGCGNIMSMQCTTFATKGFNGTADSGVRSRVCTECIRCQERITTKMALGRIFLEDLLSPDDIAEVDRALDRKTVKQLLQIERHGIPVGRIAAYETLLNGKKRDFAFNHSEANAYVGYVRGSLLALRAMEGLFGREAPFALVTYNSLYAVNRSISLLAESRGIKAMSLHAGPNLSTWLETLLIGRGNGYDHPTHLKSLWPLFSALPCGAAAAAHITDHLVESSKGESAFTYSSPVTSVGDLRRRFGVRPHQKILLATMSSYDERFAAEAVGAIAPPVSTLFPQQVDWIKHLIGLISERDDWFLIVRVHPRDFPNKREGQLSDHARTLQKEFSAAPPNVAINWPADLISMYDLACETDVILNGWSSAGKEMAMLGLPVVGYSAALLGYPETLNIIGETHAAYLDGIESALKSGWSFERMRMTYRWLALEQIYSVADISDGFSRRRVRRSMFRRAIERIWRLVFNQDFLESRDMRRRPRPLKNTALIVKAFVGANNSLADVAEKPVATFAEETAALTVELSRIAAHLRLSTRPDSLLARSILGFLAGQAEGVC